MSRSASVGGAASRVRERSRTENRVRLITCAAHAGFNTVAGAGFPRPRPVRARARTAWPAGRAGEERRLPGPARRPGRLARVAGVTDSSKRPPAVFDLDNTLADTAHRQHFLERRPRDWDGFFAAAPQDPPLAEGVALALRAPARARSAASPGVPSGAAGTPWTGLAAHGPPGRDGCTCGATPTAGRPGSPAEILRRLARDREIRVLVDDDELVCDDAERAGFTVVRARWAAKSAALRDAQEREGRT